MQRLFFSLKFIPEQQQLLLPYQQQALDLCPAAKAVDVDNLHLTLFFLGQVDATQQQRLISAAQQITIPPFSLTLDTLSSFIKPKILYLAPSQQPDALLQLQQQVAQCCKALGFSDIHDKYRPHITLARHAVCDAALQQPVEPLTLLVSEFALYQSVNINGAVRYLPETVFGERHSGTA
ncbi:RNA 2',3'-cyclic phosphodiesterase [Rheinheimera nanhaiensis]|uniref:RNA 2',3'-cyclic phosphodiesterase n=1 Tax=Rheinheimera nanhaiensis E407-8 TaxID=562729 RepID=I1DTU1_9GAMM|nr:RNA 2',3'-cyclic phosphodiesterase [Rheinheimera nanhaiensis]GAB57469.1 2'-5' RNA ligase [Rheinheimera nanhaiensis E407-8]